MLILVVSESCLTDYRTERQATNGNSVGGGVGRVGRVKNDSDVKDKESLLRKEMIQQRVRMKEVSKISR